MVFLGGACHRTTRIRDETGEVCRWLGQIWGRVGEIQGQGWRNLRQGWGKLAGLGKWRRVRKAWVLHRVGERCGQGWRNEPRLAQQWALRSVAQSIRQKRKAKQTIEKDT